jgi:hypothetical protein
MKLFDMELDCARVFGCDSIFRNRCTYRVSKGLLHFVTLVSLVAGDVTEIVTTGCCIRTFSFRKSTGLQWAEMKH